MLVVLLVPLLLAVGVAVDFARMVQFRSDLQNAVDEAALAGAAVFVDSTQSALATTVATNYFNRAILPVSVSVSAPKVTPNASGTINPALGTAVAHTVTVSASAQVATTLMALVVPSMETISVTATAANPVVQATLKFPATTSNACDGNTAYLYEVPANSTNTGYDYSKVPAATAADGTSNYYEIYTSYSQGVTATQTLPTFSVNQPLGIMLENDTDGNAAATNAVCGTDVTGANSYGAPYHASQYFYSSLLMNGESPSELANYKYTAQVTTQTTTSGSGKHSTSTTNVTAYSITLANGTSLATPPVSSLPSTYTDQLATIFGGASCTATGTTQASSTQSTTSYTCTTQYRTSAQGTGNCSLYVQTGEGVTSSYLKGLTKDSVPPAADRGNCFNMTSGGAANSAPTCAQLSALASGSGSSATAPAAVFWWDDAGGVGPNEPYYGPSSHCSQIGSSSPGYGEDCQYKNMVVALQCEASGGSGTGYTSVVLTQ